LKRYLKSKGAVIGVVTGVVVLITLLSVFLTGGRVSFIQNGVATLLGPLERGIVRFVGTLEQLYDQMYGYDELEARYQELRDRVAAYERMAWEAEEIREENQRLRELLGFTMDIHNEHYIDARVISWDASNWTSAFTIDRGSDAGIAVGDPVMTERRELVGEVRQVGRDWATVQTILDPGVRLGGQLGTGVSAVAEGNFALMQIQMLRLSFIPTGEVPLLGDAVTTSGVGGVIPNGLLIGRVYAVAIEDTGISYYAIIEPAADLYRLVQVFVVQTMRDEG